MHPLLTSARQRLDAALSGELADPTGEAILSMYDALLSALTNDERAQYSDHPNAAAARTAATRLALPEDQADHAVQVVWLYYAHNRDTLVPLSDAVYLACLVYEAASKGVAK